MVVRSRVYYNFKISAIFKRMVFPYFVIVGAITYLFEILFM